MQVTVAERSLVVVAVSTVLLALMEVTVMAVIPRVVSSSSTSPGSMDNSGNSSSSVGIQHRFYHNRYGKQPLGNGEAAFLGDGLFRSSKKSDREPRFISFQTKDDNIEVEVDFAIPFLTIPVKRSVDGMMSSVMKGVPILNVNVGAVLLAGVLAIGGALLGAAVRLFRDHNMAVPFSLSPQPLRADQSDNSKKERGNDYQTWSPLWSLMERVDRSLQKFDIDSTACSQRMVCWYVKEAMNNVDEQRASTLDVVINGLSSADWAMKFTTGTAIEDAIRVGRRNVNCEQAFPSCRIAPETVQRMIKNSSKGRSKK